MMGTLWRWLAMTLALAVALGAVVGLHLWLVSRLLVAPGWLTTPVSGLGLVAGAIGLMVAAMLAERFVAPPWLRLFTWPGYLWMGLALLWIVGVALSELVMWPLGLLDSLPALRWRALGVVVGGVVVAAVGVVTALRPRLHEIVLEVPGWPEALDGFRIVQLSDLHIGPILGRRWLARIVARVQALSPELIVITGDLIDGLVPRVGPETLPLARLEAPHGVFAVTGNHEMFCGPRHWTRHYREALGLRVLENERVAIRASSSPSEGFVLAGTHDRSGRHFGCAEDLEAVFAGWEPAVEGPMVLLAHDPLTFPEAARRGVDVQLSGHTHGGQIWPLHVFVRLVVPFLSGHHRRGASQLHVSRGTGFWGPPMRLLAPSEIVLVRLRAPVA